MKVSVAIVIIELVLITTFAIFLIHPFSKKVKTPDWIEEYGPAVVIKR